MIIGKLILSPTSPLGSHGVFYLAPSNGTKKAHRTGTSPNSMVLHSVLSGYWGGVDDPLAHSTNGVVNLHDIQLASVLYL